MAYISIRFTYSQEPQFLWVRIWNTFASDTSIRLAAWGYSGGSHREGLGVGRDGTRPRWWGGEKRKMEVEGVESYAMWKIKLQAARLIGLY